MLTNKKNGRLGFTRAASITGISALALCSVCGTIANAQTTATGTGSGASPTTFSQTGASATAPDIDYTVLADQNLNYFDIQRGKGFGLTDDEIATAAQIADKAGVRLSRVIDRVTEGATFSTIAEELGVGADTISPTQEYKDKIANYLTAYNATGTKALSMRSEPMSQIGQTSSLSTSSTWSNSNTSTTTPNTWSNSASSTTTPGASASSTLGNSSASSSAPLSTSTTPTTGLTITDVLANNGQFNTLTRALQTANLAGYLRNNGPFTLFAPTDAAFAKLSTNQLNSLLSNPQQLSKVLQYHLIPGKITAAQAEAMTSPTTPPTVEGDTLQVTTSGGNVMVNGVATVTQPDIQASNGVIHGIDTVLIPTSINLGSTSSNSKSTGSMSTTPDTASSPDNSSSTQVYPNTGQPSGTPAPSLNGSINAPNTTPSVPSGGDSTGVNGSTATPNGGATTSPNTYSTSPNASSITPETTSPNTVSPNNTNGTTNGTTGVDNGVNGNSGTNNPSTTNTPSSSTGVSGANGVDSTTSPSNTNTNGNGMSNSTGVGSPSTDNGTSSTSGSAQSGASGTSGASSTGSTGTSAP